MALIDTEDWSMCVTDMPKEPAKGGKNATSPTGVGAVFDAAAPDYVFVEDVWSSPQMGVVSAFTFGRNLGIVLGAGAARAMLTLVRPQEWKAKTQTPKDKNQARRRAMQLFPNHVDLFARVKDDGRAEAAIITLFGLLSMGMAPPRPLARVEFP